ncbi:hypothetical protein GCM10010331_69530 [Streptomyces xanthochromogenes]|uniref:hypothetical protein n=1 Tax=Streptomyces xanthochromogenes TaxID=67384 RepID=UPI00167575D0|nr:hypothetical protein [Streptomyces xanthochromogenes]GHB71683.1 hypothetical protein GCM10010331_69530 [Streptomyces xanthochromogenes]
MPSKDLLTELSLVPEKNWLTSPSSGDPGTITWLPLAQVSETGIWLGVDRNGSWAIGRLDGPVQPSAMNLPTSWVTILDVDEAEFRQNLKAGAQQHRISEGELQEHVPVDEVLTIAILSESDHWAERAVSWLSNRTNQKAHLELLRELSKAKWATQKTRHAAYRLVKRTESPSPRKAANQIADESSVADN